MKPSPTNRRSGTWARWCIFLIGLGICGIAQNRASGNQSVVAQNRRAHCDAGLSRHSLLAAAVTGLRVSELLALKWEDVDFAAGEMNLTRAIVCQHVGPLKTAASQKPVPMDAGLSALLLDWRGRCPYNQEQDYVFASLAKDGAQPLWPSSAMSNHIRPAAKLAGILKHVR